MKSKTFSFYFWHIAALLIMIVIFAFSAQSGDDSSGTSSGIIQTLLGKPEGAYAEFMLSGGISPYASTEYFLRKAAHFLEYAVLGFCVAKAAVCHNIDIEKVLCYSLLICSVYALSDEFHQLFVSDRSASPADVLIDISGVYSGIFTAIVLRSIKLLPKYNK